MADPRYYRLNIYVPLRCELFVADRDLANAAINEWKEWLSTPATRDDDAVLSVEGISNDLARDMHTLDVMMGKIELMEVEAY